MNRATTLATNGQMDHVGIVCSNRDSIIVMVVKFNVFRIVYSCQPELGLAF